MEIARLTLITSPENHFQKYDVTPAEALILKELHFQYSNGTPLTNLFIQDGEAITIDAPEKPAQEKYFDQTRGEHIAAVPAVPAKTHKRTNAEEIARLKKKYIGNITRNGVSLPAFAAVFGTQPNVTLPQTFKDVEEALGIVLQREADAPQQSEFGQRAFELSPKSRPELVEIALGYKLKIAANDSKEFIIAAIINAESKAKAVVADDKE